MALFRTQRIGVLPLLLGGIALWQWHARMCEREAARAQAHVPRSKPAETTWEGEGGALRGTGAQTGPDPAGPVAGAGIVNATELWSELRHSTERRFDEYLAAGSEERDSVQRRLLLALELRWKLEEQLLLPALAECGPAHRAAARETGEEIALLRELAALCEGEELSAAASIVVMGVLEGIAELRSTELERVMITARTVDDESLAREMQAMLKRWRGEIRKTGEVEDEERDPVGMPPR